MIGWKGLKEIDIFKNVCINKIGIILILMDMLIWEGENV